jgi:type II secretory ATPase GspE/PulE/Tfp pilus assembly ATPase PilB-like protein
MVLDPSLSDADKQKELSAKLLLLGQEQEERMAQYRAQQTGLPYVNLTAFPMDAEVLEVIPRTQAQDAAVVLFYKLGKDLRIGVVNPGQKGVKEVLKMLEDRFGVEPQMHVISHRSLKVALSRYSRESEEEEIPKGEVRVTDEEVSAFSKTLKTLEDLGQRITSLPPTEVLNAIVVGAVTVASSDIHIEPKEKDARLRYRIDGVLQDITTFNRQGWALLLSRVKVLSRLKLNVKERPQDGSFVLRVGSETYDMRVSTLPGLHGENIVMRILSRKAEAIQIKDLGMKMRDEIVVRKELKRSNGMILITGPTGSGKTTTLAAFLREVNNPDLKIITLEDPIEYRIAGIEQTQVDDSAGYTFAKGLRSILRQDPDMIMVGEMRDAETAETAVHAALTGHLVFSTLHTNNAAGAVPRLVDMGIKPFVLAPALNLIVAQRLVRVVCPDCAQPYTPDTTIKEKILEIMRGISPEIFTPAVLQKPDLKFYKAKGCSKCARTGYRGRVGVFEIFSVEGQMEQLVLNAADSTQIEAEALKQGMTTIAQDAYLKVIEGVTTVEEVERVSEE